MLFESGLSLKRVKTKLDVNCWIIFALIMTKQAVTVGGKVFLDFQFGQNQLFEKFVVWFFSKFKHHSRKLSF